MSPRPASPPGGSVALAGLIFDLLALCIGGIGVAGAGLLPLPPDMIVPFMVANGIVIPVMFGLIGGLFGIVGMVRAEKFRWPFWVGAVAMIMAGPGLIMAAITALPLAISSIGYQG